MPFPVYCASVNNSHWVKHKISTTYETVLNQNPNNSYGEGRKERHILGWIEKIGLQQSRHGRISSGQMNFWIIKNEIL